MKTRIEVSHEMDAFLGAGPLPPCEHPDQAVALAFDVTGATLAFDPAVAAIRDTHDAQVVFVVRTDACRRVFGSVPDAASAWHLPSELRSIALSILECRAECEAGATLRMAKCIELLCVSFEKLDGDHLVPADGAGELSAMEARRIADARRLIDERWNEKLTLETIARSCGINRVKLTRGFRTMFAMSVGDAIVERRLGGAREMLLSTDLPVSSIGYKCGYLNNASFSRAFSRRFGQTPSDLRSGRLAA